MSSPTKNENFISAQSRHCHRRSSCKDLLIGYPWVLFWAALPLVLALSLPLPGVLSRSGAAVLGIFAGTLVLWFTTAIDWPSLLLLLGLAMIPELGMNKVLAASLGSGTVAFLIFTFTCTYALTTTGVVKQVALLCIRNRLAASGGRRFMCLYFAAVLLLGLFLSPTILFILFLPLHHETCALLKLERGSRSAAALMIGQTFLCALSSGMTPISHVFAILAMDYYQNVFKKVIGYGQYMAVMLPVGLAGAAIIVTSLIIWARREMPALSAVLQADNWPKHVEKWQPQGREIKILFVFILVIVLWLLPSFLPAQTEGMGKWLKQLGTAWPPLLGAVLLFLLGSTERPLIKFKETTAQGIAWGSILMCAATLAMGMALTERTLGLNNFLHQLLAKVTAEVSAPVLLLIIAVWATLQTNFSSNIVTVSLVTTVALPLAAAGGRLNPAIVACFIGFLASCSFAAPSAHPNVALAIGTGYVTTGQMLVSGLAAGAMMVGLLAVVGYPLAGLIF